MTVANAKAREKALNRKPRHWEPPKVERPTLTIHNLDGSTSTVEVTPLWQP